MLPESKAKKMPITQEHLDAINAVRDLDEALLEVDAVAAGGTSHSKTGTVCANHLRFPGNCYRCFDPERCLLKDAVIQRPSSSGVAIVRIGLSRSGSDLVCSPQCLRLSVFCLVANKRYSF